IAEAALPRIRNLNPRVNLTSLNLDIADTAAANPTFFKDFDLVLVATKLPFRELISINNACREHQVKFVSCAVFGTMGYMFSDLLQERKTEAGGVLTVKRTKKSESYCSLEHSSTTTKFNGVRPRALKRIHPVYFGLHLLWEYERKYFSFPHPEVKEDAEKLESLRGEYIASTGGDVSVIEELLSADLVQFLAQQAQLELSPVCAIVGGIVSQDVLNVVSGKEVDVCNFFCFGDTAGGVVKAFGSSGDGGEKQ
ncbi:hypothetical protein HK100_010395, partial [Physocladia obscura]